MADPSELTMIYATFPNNETARTVAKTMLLEKLAVCISISSPVTSFYHWEGQLHEDQEVQVFVKTFKSQVHTVLDAIKKLHPYQVPCLLEIPLGAVDSSYNNWASTCL